MADKGEGKSIESFVIDSFMLKIISNMDDQVTAFDEMIELFDTAIADDKSENYDSVRLSRDSYSSIRKFRHSSEGVLEDSINSVIEAIDFGIQLVTTMSDEELMSLIAQCPRLYRLLPNPSNAVRDYYLMLEKL